MAKYNIIWADDDVHALHKGAAEILNLYGFEVVEKCTCGHALNKSLEKCKLQRIDAVIVDANFPYKDEDSDFTDRQIEGLNAALEEMGKYPNIPFYLYSGKGLLVSNLQERIRQHFQPRKAIFDKSKGIVPLLERIIEDVEYRKTSTFLIETNFSEELNCAKNFDSVIKEAKAENFVRMNLIHSIDNSWNYEKERPQDVLNAERKIIESMFDFIKNPELSIIPPLKELNAISKFLCGQEVENDDCTYKMKKDAEIMPKPLARSLWYCLDIVQDGSHLRGNLKLGVDKYLTETQNSNILRSVLHILIDLLRWFVNYVPNHTDKVMNQNKWTVIHKNIQAGQIN